MPANDDLELNYVPDLIDKFIAVGKRVAGLPILATAEFDEVARGLRTITKKLHESTEDMSSWITRVRYFNFDDANWRANFQAFAKEFTDTRAGGGFEKMRFPCGEIHKIYRDTVKEKLALLFPGDSTAASEADWAFIALGEADSYMVDFITNQVVSNIANYLDNALPSAKLKEINAVIRQLRIFEAATSALLSRLIVLGGGLSELELQLANLTGWVDDDDR